MSEFQIKQCPVCGESDFSSYLTTNDFFVSGEKFEIKQCAGCEMKITFNAKDEYHIGRYYQSEEYVSHSNTGKGIVNSVYHLVRKYMLGQKRKLIEKVSKNHLGHILDVGTGTGFFLNEMKIHGWKVEGTEKSPEARKFAEDHFDLNLKPADALLNFDRNSFDVITLWHVLEHIHRLNEYMDAFSRVLKPEGKLIIALPNWSSFDARYYEKYWAAWDVPRHLWHLAPPQMKILGKRYNFRLQKMYNMPFDSFYVSILSEKYKKSKFPIFKGVLVGKISWFSSLIGKGRGSSVIYVFEKNLQ